ncbi:MAG: 2Fe-2S iron-sulfur cluster-binding protein [Chloroflexales bacterium]
MSTITINDVAMEAKVGERLLNVARRNAAHIGFMCDNAGTCQGCRCQVLAGADQLSPPSEAEQAWIPADRLAEGQRLACQAIIHGQGDIRVLSRAEELRRLVLAVGTRGLAGLPPLITILARASVEQLSRFPGNVFSSIMRIGPVRFALPVVDRERLFGDVSSVVKHMRAAPALPARQKARAIPILLAEPVATPPRLADSSTGKRPNDR